MTYDEFKKVIIATLKENIEAAQKAGERAADDKETGIYLGYSKHAREMLNLMFDLWIQPEICDKCQTPSVYNPERLYRYLCAKCATEELHGIMVKP